MYFSSYKGVVYKSCIWENNRSKYLIKTELVLLVTFVVNPGDSETKWTGKLRFFLLQFLDFKVFFS